MLKERGKRVICSGISQVKERDKRSNLKIRLGNNVTI